MELVLADTDGAGELEDGVPQPLCEARWAQHGQGVRRAALLHQNRDEPGVGGADPQKLRKHRRP